MYNHGDKNNSSMMWLMMIGCLLPILFIVLSGSGSSLSQWLILGAIVVFIGVHFWSMRKSHHRSVVWPQDSKPDQNAPPDHSGHISY